MRILPVVTPTPEQLDLLTANQGGVLVIKGAAGSGKTTTALLRLRHLCGTWSARHRRLGLAGPVRVLVLTYNRTLEGYIAELAYRQVPASDNVHLVVTTFAKFACDLVGEHPDDYADTILARLLTDFGMPRSFLEDEVQYVLGRFEPGRLEEYMVTVREGRGNSPRMPGPTKRRLLDEVIYPYLKQKHRQGVCDWNDIAIAAGETTDQPWDVVIVDETQDFSANQVRAILTHLAPEHSITFVLDAAQRIYPRSFTWKEVGVQVTSASSKTLRRNHRNTRQIAAFARGVIEGLTLGDDGVLPDLNAATESGPLPTVLVGTFAQQMRWVLDNVVVADELADESVAFLHPKGGGWFAHVRQQLKDHDVPYVELTRSPCWPDGDETVGLCTIHSAKGLEFDHVVLLGLNQQVTPHGDGDGDVDLETLRRLLAMGIGRARTTVTLGFKPGEESTLISFLDPTTYKRIDL